LDFYSASSLKQHTVCSVGGHVTPL